MIEEGEAMIDIKFLRENPDIVRQNIKNKFQDFKLPMVDEVIELDEKLRKTKAEADELRSKRNKISKEIGALMAQGKREEAEQVKASVASIGETLAGLEPLEAELEEKVKKIMKFSGPRMLLHHPLLVISHMLSKLKK